MKMRVRNLLPGDIFTDGNLSWQVIEQDGDGTFGTDTLCICTRTVADVNEFDADKTVSEWLEEDFTSRYDMLLLPTTSERFFLPYLKDLYVLGDRLVETKDFLVLNDNMEIKATNTNGKSKGTISHVRPCCYIEGSTEVLGKMENGAYYILAEEDVCDLEEAKEELNDLYEEILNKRCELETERPVSKQVSKLMEEAMYKLLEASSLVNVELTRIEREEREKRARFR